MFLHFLRLCSLKSNGWTVLIVWGNISTSAVDTLRQFRICTFV